MATNYTKRVERIYLSSEGFEKNVDLFLDSQVHSLLSRFNALFERLEEIFFSSTNSFVKIETKPFYYFIDGGFFFADLDRKDAPDLYGESFVGFPVSPLSLGQIVALAPVVSKCEMFKNRGGSYGVKKKDSTYFVVLDGSSYRSCYILNSSTGSVNYYTSNSSDSYFPRDYIRLPVLNMKFGLANILKRELLPEGLSQEEKNLFKLAFAYLKNGYFIFSSDETKWTAIGFSQKFYLELGEEKIDDVDDILLKRSSLISLIEKGDAIEADDKIIDEFLQADTVRAGITPYHISMLTDPNGGLWELWDDGAHENSKSIKISNLIYAKNPCADVQSNATVGIDFGTKSTVVAIKNGTDEILLERIGSGDLFSDAAISDYENPTVIEFIDFNSFMKDYRSGKYRPKTKWTDLTISHEAADSMKNADANCEYFAWFSDLKQWANDRSRIINISDKSGMETMELPPYQDISNFSGDAFDPIEVYAYLLGLFINNQHKGIYLKYRLSFPVTYDRKTRSCIMLSFERGIKKSIPATVLSNDRFAQLFSVKEGASEPAAYAVCALKKYIPELGDEKVLYGVFDFGGGTTDFDFGIWRNSNDERHFDYEIEHFGAGGDSLLGGENLLEQIAYEVFADNQSVLRGDKDNKGNTNATQEKSSSTLIQFTKPAGCRDFPNSSTFISNSQQARKNMKQLCNALRPFWEENKPFEGKGITVNLLSADNTVKTVELKPNAEKLDSILNSRIEKGVKNFFEAMKLAFSRRKDDIRGCDKVRIFLAGNSCRSPRVEKAFNNNRARNLSDIAEILGIELQPVPETKADDKARKEPGNSPSKKTQTEENPRDNLFVIYPALGTKQANDILKEKGIEISEDYFREPTGKTGVAYGLLIPRVKVIDDDNDRSSEISFRYYLGYVSRNKFKPVILRNAEYGKWIVFDDSLADCDGEYELYYSSLPEAETGNMSSDGISKIDLRFFCDNPECMKLFIRIENPDTISYAVAENEAECDRERIELPALV